MDSTGDFFHYIIYKCTQNIVALGQSEDQGWRESYKESLACALVSMEEWAPICEHSRSMDQTLSQEINVVGCTDH